MINLLPVEEKKAIEKEYKLRVVSIYIMFVIAAIVIGLVMLLPAYFLVNVVEGDLEKEVSILEASSESTKMDEINSELRLTEDRLRAITESKDTIALYKVIEKISSYRTTGINISNISYARGAGERESKLILAGSASSRDGLLEFTKEMENDELFSEVVLPVSSLAQKIDIDFSVEVKGNF